MSKSGGTRADGDFLSNGGGVWWAGEEGVGLFQSVPRTTTLVGGDGLGSGLHFDVLAVDELELALPEPITAPTLLEGVLGLVRNEAIGAGVVNGHRTSSWWEQWECSVNQYPCEVSLIVIPGD